LGIVVGAVYQAFSILLLVPFLYRVTGTPLDLSQFASRPGSIPNLVVWLAISWIFAAFLEELTYRGYIFSRITDLLGDSRWSLGVGVFLSAALDFICIRDATCGCRSLRMA
jgi:membrane protease YdiL (CAAX protease family)